MDKLRIEGGQQLEGEVDISGSKNAALPMMTATLLSEEPSTLYGLPELADVTTLGKVLNHLGVGSEHEASKIVFSPKNIKTVEATYDLVRKMRASVLVLGPLLARFGRARVSLPGGCAIGARPIDLHLKGFKAFGAEITLEHGYVDAKASAGGLKGAHIVLDFPSVGATENLLMAATLAKGESCLENVAREPEIIHLANALKSMGAQIEGIGTGILRIQGVDALSGFRGAVPADRIETGTFIAAAAMTGSKIQLNHVLPDELDAVVDRFEAVGCKFETQNSEQSHTGKVLMVQGPKELNPVDIRTAPFPGYPTDMQAQMMACMCLAKGTSIFHETIFENRFMHVMELDRMGARIRVDGNQAVVRGVPFLSGAPVMATDLRASASLVVAALAARGVTDVLRIYHLDRGYVRLEEKLKKLNARIERLAQE